MTTKYAVLRSQHQIEEIIPADEILEVICMAGNHQAEDLIKVRCVDGATIYWCDYIEFTYEKPEY